MALEACSLLLTQTLWRPWWRPGSPAMCQQLCVVPRLVHTGWGAQARFSGLVDPSLTGLVPTTNLPVPRSHFSSWRSRLAFSPLHQPLRSLCPRGPSQGPAPQPLPVPAGLVSSFPSAVKRPGSSLPSSPSLVPALSARLPPAWPGAGAALLSYLLLFGSHFESWQRQEVGRVGGEPRKLHPRAPKMPCPATCPASGSLARRSPSLWVLEELSVSGKGP